MCVLMYGCARIHTYLKVLHIIVFSDLAVMYVRKCVHCCHFVDVNTHT